MIINTIVLYSKLSQPLQFIWC